MSVCMSGQSSILIVVMIVAVLAVLWASTTFNQFSIRNRITTSEAYNKFAKYLDIIKGFSRSSLQLATYKATYEVAQEARTYYCNKATPPSYKVIINDLGSVTEDNFNSYISNLKFSEPLLKIDVKKGSCVNFDVTPDKLNSGSLDERFGISLYGSNIRISGGDNNVFSDNNIFSDILVRDRFWKLFRGFEKWSKTTKVFDNACDSCASEACGCQNINCGGCSSCPSLNECVIRKIVNKGVLELENRIFSDDPFIECTGNTHMCYLDLSPAYCKPKGVCGPFEENKCQQCDTNRNDKLCVDDILSYGLAKAAVTCVYDKKDVKAGVSVIFTCVDKKYALSVPELGGDRYLKFSVKTYFSFEQQAACEKRGTFGSPPPNACDCGKVAPGPIEEKTIEKEAVNVGTGSGGGSGSGTGTPSTPSESSGSSSPSTPEDVKGGFEREQGEPKPEPGPKPQGEKPSPPGAP